MKKKVIKEEIGPETMTLEDEGKKVNERYHDEVSSYDKEWDEPGEDFGRTYGSIRARNFAKKVWGRKGGYQTEEQYNEKKFVKDNMNCFVISGTKKDPIDHTKLYLYIKKGADGNPASWFLVSKIDATIPFKSQAEAEKFIELFRDLPGYADERKTLGMLNDGHELEIIPMRNVARDKGLVEAEDEKVNEAASIEIKTSHIKDKTYATFETPGGDVDITFDGDPDTIDELLRVIKAGLEDSSYNSAFDADPDAISFYTKASPAMLHEDEMLGTETKFAPNTVGAMVGLLQKKGEMTGTLTTRLIDSFENIMPVGITAENGNVVLDFAKGSPAVEVTPPVADPVEDTFATEDAEV